jgi:signal transduction histidine kinase
MTRAPAETLAELRRLPFLATLSEEAAACLADGSELHFATGETILREGDPVEAFYVLLAGQARVTRQYGRQEIVMADPEAGTFFGEIQILLDSPYVATFRARTDCRIFRLPKDAFWELLRLSPAAAREIFQTMATRVRNAESFGQQRERLASLGTMAAGLAHELYQPAQAARNAVSRLRESVDRIEHCLCELNQHGLTPEQWARLDALLGPEAADGTATAGASHALEPWLRERPDLEGAREPLMAALEPLARAGVTSETLAGLVAALPAAALPDALCWLAARLDTAAQLASSDRSTQRITGLVKAVKSYTFLDRAPMQELDVHEGLESTLAVLAHRLRGHGGIVLTREYDRTLPRLCAYGSELNQVWTSLLENALDAIDGNGRLWVRTRRADEETASVEIADDGPGFGEDVRSRLFEPFFTTKPNGASTGMGLFIASRIVTDRHGGQIQAESQPGNTRFIVRLPLLRRVE